MSIIYLESESKMSKKRPHYAHTFLHRQGIKIMPSQNFIDKFKEFYVEINNKSKSRKHIDTLDNETAIFFIISVIESIIYCIDAGLNLHFRCLLKINQKITDYRHNIKTHMVGVVEDVKKVSISLLSHLVLKTKEVANKDNKVYLDYIQGKKDRHIEIKKYYREFYGKQDEWWQDI